MAEKRQKKQAVKAFEKETFSKDKEVTGVKHIEHRQDNTFSVENQFSASEKPVSNLPRDANHGSRTGKATSGHSVQKSEFNTGTEYRKNNKKKYALVIILILFIAFFSSQCMMTRTNTESKKTVAVILPYTYNKENSRILDAIRDYAHNNSIILDVWHEKSLSSNELSSIIANEEQNHAIGILLIYPENYLTQQEKHYDYNNVLAITATMQTAFSHYAAFENSPSSSYLLPVSAQVIKKIQDGKTDCIYIKNTYELGYESIQMLDTYSRNKYMKDISIPCHKVDKAAIESGELDALLTN